MRYVATIILAIAALVTNNATAAAASPAPDKPSASSASDRSWAVNRPSRSVSIVRAASTVPPSWRPFASCVLSRESGASLDRPQSGAGARNPSSSASGRWQFLQGTWGQSLPYMVADQLRDHGATKKQAKAVRVHLQSIPISRWPGVYQDMGFIEVAQQGGWRHWYLGGSRCNSLVP